jgi:hypothetical protein
VGRKEDLAELDEAKGAKAKDSEAHPSRKHLRMRIRHLFGIFRVRGSGSGVRGLGTRP